MEVSELITILREDYLDDTFNGWETATEAEKADQFLWSDSFLLRSLTEAQRQACNRTDFLFDDDGTFNVTLVAGSPTYQLDRNITFIEQVTFDETDVAHMSKEEFQAKYPKWRTDTGMTGKLCSYVMRGHKLRIYPIPDATDAGKTLSIDVYHLPVETIASTSDELSIPSEYHRDLIWWVLYECYSKQDADGYDPKRAETYLANFNASFGQYVPSEVRLNQLQESQSLRPRPINYLSSSDGSDEDW